MVSAFGRPIPVMKPRYTPKSTEIRVQYTYACFVYTKNDQCDTFLVLYSEFDLPWFDLTAREAKESVRTTRSRAKAAKPSIAESSGN